MVKIIEIFSPEYPPMMHLIKTGTNFSVHYSAEAERKYEEWKIQTGKKRNLEGELYKILGNFISKLIENPETSDLKKDFTFSGNKYSINIKQEKK